ncbi:MAG: hypothetical protein H7Z20_04115 [Bdellovibrio sp.]|nr:hypothetical protein [Methylotenera sp.]
MTLNNFKVMQEEIEFRSFTGEVLSHINTAKPMFGLGSGGHIGPHGGHVAAAQAHSSVTTKQEFWLKLADGTEKSVQLNGYDIPLRESQKISILMAQTKTSKSAYYVALINLTSSLTHIIHGAESILEELIDFYPNRLSSFLMFLIKLIFFIGLFIGTRVLYPG